VLEELTIYYIQGLRAHAQDIVLSREYSFKGSRRSYAQGLRVQIVLKISYETTDRICVHHAEQVRLRSFERDRIQGLRAHAQDTVLRKTRIDVLYAKQSYEPFSWKSCPRPPSGIYEYPHDPPEEQELAPNCHTIKRPPSGICEQLTDPPGEQSWHLTAPDLPPASANTPTSPPEAYRAGT
jgi:hypothetical protein